MRVEDGLVLVDAVRGVNCYLVDTPEGLVLVDTGMPGSAAKILKTMEGLDRSRMTSSTSSSLTPTSTMSAAPRRSRRRRARPLRSGRSTRRA